jgi:hypothetical protein
VLGCLLFRRGHGKVGVLDGTCDKVFHRTLSRIPDQGEIYLLPYVCQAGASDGVMDVCVPEPNQMESQALGSSSSVQNGFLQATIANVRIGITR